MKLTIMQGNVFDRIKEIQDNSIDLVITSPPYWGLRDYGIEGQLGNEPTMEKYLDNTITWVKEVYRILKPTGSFVLNIGDCFVGGGNAGTTKNSQNITSPIQGKNLKNLNEKYYKAKQLLSVSSFAYCRIVSETDFVCRGEHIWAKPNVPTPIRSRLKHSHEKLFWFVKDADKYYFDTKAWMKKTQITDRYNYDFKVHAGAENVGVSETSCFRKKALKERNNAYGEDQNATPGKRGCGMNNEETIEHSWRIVPVGEKQNGFEMEGKRPVSEHIAPFPTKLIEPYIQSLCPSEGIVLDPFLGSGTTMRVAMENGRNSMGIELNEKYIEYAKKRLNWKQGLETEYEG